MDSSDHAGAGVGEEAVVPGADSQTVEACLRPDDNAPHGHRFQDLDIGAGRSDEGREDDGGLFVGGTDIRDEGFENNVRDVQV